MPVDMSGVLAGKTIVATAMSNGYSHNLALASDGTLAAWGYNTSGALGSGGTVIATAPVLVSRTGVLAGKTVMAVAAGYEHSLALCSDGTLAAWGSDFYGQLGNSSGNNSSSVPVLVDRTGVLAGKTVMAIAAGNSHNLALCEDGTLAAWGDNAYGTLGNNSTTIGYVPVLVDRTGVLAGKTVIGIAAGNSHSLALCSDGTMAAWGTGSGGQLGNASTSDSYVPVLVDRTGALSGKTVTAIATGNSHNLALCADGTLVAWGNNSIGQLGNNSTTNSNVPVVVDRSGVLAGKTVLAVSAGASHSLAVCADGTLAAWGLNSNGQLGNNSTTQSNVPVAVTTSGLGTGALFVSAGAGSTYSLALAAAPPPPVATTLAATAVKDSGATLNGSVYANGFSTAVTFEYGLTTAYGNTVTATPATLTGVTATAVSSIRSGLLSGATYHYRVVAANGSGTVTGEDMTFTTTTFANLTGLSLSKGILGPSFDSNRTSYAATVPYATSSITVTPVTAYATSTVKVNNVTVASGSA
ncbi:MAG: cadherin-like beta sandwich domain-containing protein, partial [Verrucomicrobia bacterium]|nr:cadherin-like beta sandwich domain-containing protein [Verrucomicrobiota bacterium]